METTFGCFSAEVALTSKINQSAYLNFHESMHSFIHSFLAFGSVYCQYLLAQGPELSSDSVVAILTHVILVSYLIQNVVFHPTGITPFLPRVTILGNPILLSQ